MTKKKKKKTNDKIPYMQRTKVWHSHMCTVRSEVMEAMCHIVQEDWILHQMAELEFCLCHFLVMCLWTSLQPF